ncbi:MAG: hypothetical protein E7186_07435 [Erysipelotrichaceae bacterium]|nr:hypothetical protein [Erysipelotrichaceae bacterium]
MTPKMAGTIVVLIMIAVAIPMFIRTAIWNRFLKYMKQDKEEEALKILNSSYYKMMFGAYSQKWNLLRFYISRNDTPQVKERIKARLADKFAPNEAYQIFSNGFFYFMSLHDEEMCSKLLSRLDDVTEGEQKEYFHMLYRVMIEQKHEDIEAVTKLIEAKEKEKDSNSKNQQLGMLEYLLGIQYHYRGDSKEADKWLRKAKNNVKGSPLEKEIKKIIH